MCLGHVCGINYSKTSPSVTWLSRSQRSTLIVMSRYQHFCIRYRYLKSNWCLVMSFCLKVCIYSHTRGVKLGLGLGFMQTSQVLPHWLNQSFSFWTLSYTQRHCHVRIEKSPNCCYNIRSTQFPRISLYALTLRFVLIEITKVVKPVH